MGVGESARSSRLPEYHIEVMIPLLTVGGSPAPRSSHARRQSIALSSDLYAPAEVRWLPLHESMDLAPREQKRPHTVNLRPRRRRVARLVADALNVSEHPIR